MRADELERQARLGLAYRRTDLGAGGLPLCLPARCAAYEAPARFDRASAVDAPAFRSPLGDLAPSGLPFCALVFIPFLLCLLAGGKDGCPSSCFRRPLVGGDHLQADTRPDQEA